jgi:arylsulfatase A-like enzyme
VLVTLESVRADHLSLHGYGQETSPKLAAIGARGVVFEHAFAPASDPQRAVMPLFSGRRFADTARDRREWPTLKDEADTLAERLAAKGYETHGISSFQWLSRERGFSQGFDEFVEVFRDEHPERGVTGPLALRSFRATLERLDRAPKPQFIWLHLFDAHEEWRRHEGLAFGRGEAGAYDSEIAFVDRLVGDVDAALAKSPLAGNTLLVIHGTYGESLGERSKPGTRGELTNEHVRVPLIVAGPGIAPARVSDRAVSTLRIAELVLSRTGVAPAEDLLSAATPPVLLETTRRRGIVVFPWKLVAAERKGKERLLLFHLGEDPGETKDRSGDETEKLRELSALLDASLPKPRKRDARR